MSKYTVYYTVHDGDYHGACVGTKSIQADKIDEWDAFEKTATRPYWYMFDGAVNNQTRKALSEYGFREETSVTSNKE